MSKQTTITLTFPTYYGDEPRKKGYRVEKVTDSTAHEPGQVLSKEEVDYLCGDDTWKVIINRDPAWWGEKLR